MRKNSQNTGWDKLYRTEAQNRRWLVSMFLLVMWVCLMGIPLIICHYLWVLTRWKWLKKVTSLFYRVSDKLSPNGRR